MVVFIIADPGSTCTAYRSGRTRLTLERHLSLVARVAEAGANAYKPQFFRADRLYPVGSQEHALLRPHELSSSALPKIKTACDAVGLEFMCSVYAPEHVPLLDPLVKRWKVASFENGHVELLRAMALTKKPIIISTGAAKWGTWQDAWKQARQSRQQRPSFLQCVSKYPAAPGDYELHPGPGMAVDDYDGVSDHTAGDCATVAVLAVACDAQFIEKHVRADDTPPENPDYAHSASPAQFRRYVAAIREAERIMAWRPSGTPDPQQETQWRYDPTTGRRGVRG